MLPMIIGCFLLAVFVRFFIPIMFGFVLAASVIAITIVCWPVIGPIFWWFLSLFITIIADAILFICIILVMLLRMAVGMSNDGIFWGFDWMTVNRMYHLLGN